MILKNIEVAGDSFDDFTPENESFFDIELILDIGGSTEGSNMFTLRVISIDWLEYFISESKGLDIFWGRHTLIIKKYDSYLIKKIILEKISEVLAESGENEFYEKFSRFAFWEFEDYKILSS